MQEGDLREETVSPTHMSPTRQLYDGSVYLHQGEGYLVTDLDVTQRTATLRRQDTTFYTQATIDG